VGGNPLSLNKPPLCPRLGPATNPGNAVYDYYYRIPAVVQTYLVAQYVLSLTTRRMCNQIGGIWGGRAPFVQGLTPGGVATSISHNAIQKTRELLYAGSGGGGTPAAPAAGTILKFIGNVTDLPNWVASEGAALGKLPIVGDGSTAYGGTMMFDVFAAALFYPEYFWYGNAHQRFLAYGVFERGDEANADKRLLRRGRRRTAQQDSPPGTNPVLQALHTDVFENIQSSYYKYLAPGDLKWRHPWKGQTNPKPGRPGAYSWVKSPRYRDTGDPVYGSLSSAKGAVPYEVGPLARMVVNGDYYAGVLSDVYNSIVGTRAIPLGPFAGANIPQWGDPGPNLGAIFSPLSLPDLGPAGLNLTYAGDAALDRYAARQYEAEKIAKAMVGWLTRLEGMIDSPTQSITSKTKPVPTGTTTGGYGWTEAPRGALGHWIVINSEGKIDKYQCVVPSTWNASPKDSFGTPGPAEKAMENIYLQDMQYPLEILRVSHSWDFCTACAVHLVKRNDKGEVEEENTIKIEPTHP
jgi:Ni,Fe-hydrogenase I large subunit